MLAEVQCRSAQRRSMFNRRKAGQSLLKSGNMRNREGSSCSLCMRIAKQNTAGSNQLCLVRFDAGTPHGSAYLPAERPLWGLLSVADLSGPGRPSH